MNPTTTDTAGSSTETSELTPTTIFGLLANDRRRFVLHCLSETVDSLALGGLAEQIATWEDDPTYDHYQRVLTDLRHVHLPKLADTGVVGYDVERETVTLLETADELTPHLQRVAAADFR